MHIIGIKKYILIEMLLIFWLKGSIGNEPALRQLMAGHRQCSNSLFKTVMLTRLAVHDDVIKRKHLPRYWPVATGGFPLQRPLTRSIDIFFDLRLNKGSKRRWSETPSGSLWRHCNWSNYTVWKIHGSISIIYIRYSNELKKKIRDGFVENCWIIFMRRHIEHGRWIVRENFSTRKVYVMACLYVEDKHTIFL